MINKPYLVAVLLGLLLLYPPFNDALVITSQDIPGSKKDTQQRLFTSQDHTTLSGRIININLATSETGQEVVSISVQAYGGNSIVYLSPNSYLDQQGLRLSIGDTVSVSGSRVLIDGVNTVLATEIGKGGKRIKLRNYKGDPLWGGSRIAPGMPTQEAAPIPAPAPVPAPEPHIVPSPTLIP